MHKLAIVIGHNRASQGAHSPHLDQSEWPLWSEWARELAAKHRPEATGFVIRVFERLNEANEITNVYRKVDAWGADASIELHFNSFTSPSACGSEVLSSGSRHSMALCGALQREIMGALYHDDERKSVNRGVKVVAPGERGGTSLHSGQAPAALIEPFFGSNSTDCELFLARQDELRVAILSAAAEFFAGLPRRDLSGSRTMRSASKQRAGAAVGSVATAAAGVAQGVNEALGEPESAVEAVSTASMLGQYLPYGAGALMIVALGAFFWTRYHADKIEDARVDDWKRGVR